MPKGRNLNVIRRCTHSGSNAVVTRIEYYPTFVVNRHTITAAYTTSSNRMLSSSFVELNIGGTSELQNPLQKPLYNQLPFCYQSAAPMVSEPLPAPPALVTPEPASQPGGHRSSLGLPALLRMLVIPLGSYYCRVGRVDTVHRKIISATCDWRLPLTAAMNHQ